MKTPPALAPAPAAPPMPPKTLLMPAKPALPPTPPPPAVNWLLLAVLLVKVNSVVLSELLLK